MILKSFFRKKIIKIYAVVITSLIIALVLLNSFMLYLFQIKNDIFIKNTLLITISEKNYFSKLKNIPEIENINRILLFEPHAENNLIIEDSSVLIQDDNKLRWDEISIFELDKIIVNSDKNMEKKLNNGEVSIGLRHYDFEKRKENISQYINNFITFNYLGVPITLKVVNIYDSYNRGEIIIADNQFQSLAKDTPNYTYSSKIMNEDKSNEIIQNIKSYASKEKHKVVLLDDAISFDDNQTIMKVDEMVSKLKIVDYVIMGILILTVIIITKNIISDLRKDNVLERKLGFNKYQIKYYTFKRLSILHILNIITGILLSYPMILIINHLTNITLNFIIPSNILHLTLIIIGSDLLLSLIVNNKSN